MATKKYVSLEKLSLYDEKIKKVISDGDAAALAAAKTYADGLAVNYEAAGNVKTAQEALQKNIDAVDAKADAAQAAADKAQGEVDALETLVGTIPETATAKDIVGYVQEKTAGIATDTALEELTGRVAGAESAIDAIEADYLKAADKTELSDAINAEKERAMGIEGGLRTDVDAVKADYLKAADKTELQGGIDDNAEAIKAISDDYLKAADKTELQGKIDAKVAQADYDAKMEEVDGDIEGLQTQINTIMNNPDAEGAINSINEFTQYVADHGAIADGFRTDINKNKEDIAAMDTAYKAADTAIQGRLDVLEAIDHEAYVAADTALKNELNTEIAKKADATDVEANAQAIEALQTAMGEGGSVDEKIEEAVAAETQARETAIAEVQADADKGIEDAAAALQAAQDASAHADELNGAMDTRMQAVEGKAHEHANKAELDLIATGDKAKWDAAAAIAHEHANKTVLDGISAEKVTAWDKVSEKADQTALQAEIERAQAAEKANADAIALFVEVSEEEINGLFA